MADGMRVLYVDDDPAFGEMAATFLEREDDRIEVVTARDAEEGLARIADGGVDCVVSDFDMPDCDGIAFLDRLREDHPDLPFILFTSKGSEEIASDAISAGVTDYLRKKGGSEQYELLANRITDAIEHRHARESYREIFEKIPDGIVIHDPEDGTITDVNARYAEMFGYERNELLQAGFETVLPDEPPYGIEDARQQVREAVDSGPRTFEWPGVRKRGERFWTEVHLAPIRLDGADRVLAVVRDITERKEHERERERRYEAIFNGTYQFTGLMEPDGTLIEANETALEFGGLDREDVIGKPFPETYWWQTDEETKRELREAIDRAADGEFVRYEVDVQGREREVTIDFSIRPVTNDEGEVTFLIPEGRNITELKALEKRERELERQNERLEEFASVVSHDLRNPLNVIQGRVDLARAECDSGHLDVAADALDRMEALIEDLLALAREGEAVSETEPVDLAEATAACWRTVDTDAATLEVETDLTIGADRSRLRQLLGNLIRNAVDHASEGNGDGVTVTVGPLEDGFYVADDGPGIPADERETVFESGYTTSADGTGFGLAIVKEIAAAHGWTVGVTESDAGGARFEITGVDVV